MALTAIAAAIWAIAGCAIEEPSLHEEEETSEGGCVLVDPQVIDGTGGAVDELEPSLGSASSGSDEGGGDLPIVQEPDPGFTPEPEPEPEPEPDSEPEPIEVRCAAPSCELDASVAS